MSNDTDTIKNALNACKDAYAAGGLDALDALSPDEIRTGVIRNRSGSKTMPGYMNGQRMHGSEDYPQGSPSPDPQAAYTRRFKNRVQQK